MADTPANPPLDLEQRMRLGETRALAELFASNRERLLRTVRFRLSARLAGRLDADDVLQEAYLAAARRLQHFAGETGVSAFIWLRSIVQQTLIDLHRHHLGVQRRDAGCEISLQAPADAMNTSAAIASRLAESQSSPSQVAVRAEIVSRVEGALGQMDQIDREVLALRHFEELSNNEVAQALGIAPKAASIRYIRAIARLKNIVAQIPGLITEPPHG